MGRRTGLSDRIVVAENLSFLLAGHAGADFDDANEVQTGLRVRWERDKLHMRTYTRACVPGATYFFTVNSAERHGNDLPTRHMNNSYAQLQEEICTKSGSKMFAVDDTQKVGIALNSLRQIPIYGVRLYPEGDTSGWYIWGGDHSEDPDFFQAVHIEHLP